MSREKIVSWEALQKQISSILSKVNKDRALALAAGVNPLFALEELGFDVEPSVRPDIEARLRFEPRTAIKLRDLRESIFKHVGHAFDINSSEALHAVLFNELKLGTAYGGKSKAEQQATYKTEQQPIHPDTKPLPVQRRGVEPTKDPLEVLSKAHPVMKPLLEYRRLESSRPRMAPRNFYDSVRQGKRSLPVREISGRLKATEKSKR